MTPAQTRDLAVSSVLAAALVAVGAGAALGGRYFKAEAEKREVLMRRQALDASGRLARANEEREQIGSYMVRYQSYVRIKVIKPNLPAADDTPEQGERLEWIERLVEAREARRLPQMTYSIAARKPHEDLPKPGPGLAFYSSRMKLDLGLLHEGDFIDYLRRLSTPPAGIFQIERCTLQSRTADKVRAAARQAGNRAAPADQSNVTASCELDWITLVEDMRPTGAGGAAKK